MILEGATAGSMADVVTKLNTGITSSTIFATFGDLMPWVISLISFNVSSNS